MGFEREVLVVDVDGTAFILRVRVVRREGAEEEVLGVGVGVGVGGERASGSVNVSEVCGPMRWDQVQ